MPDFEETLKKIAELRDDLSKKLLPYLKELFQAELSKNPEIEKVEWCQYTPYFNDGDACEFQVHDVSVFIKGDEDACAYEGSSLFFSPDQPYGKSSIEHIEDLCGKGSYLRLYECRKTLNHKILAIDTDIMAAVIGDGFKVRVEIDENGETKISCQEYDHD